NRSSAAQSCEPAEYLNSVRYCNQHARRGEKACSELRQAGDEHVVDPQPERQEPDGDQRKDERQVTEHRAASESSNYRRPHSWSTLLEYRDDEFHRDCQCRDLSERDHLGPHIGALARRKVGTRERHIGKPAHVGADLKHERYPEEGAAEQVDPVAECVEPWK